MYAFVAVLLALKRFLSPAGYDPAAAAEAGAELTPKLAALGLVCPPAAAITAAVSYCSAGPLRTRMTTSVPPLLFVLVVSQWRIPLFNAIYSKTCSSGCFCLVHCCCQPVSITATSTQPSAVCLQVCAGVPITALGCPLPCWTHQQHHCSPPPAASPQHHPPAVCLCRFVLVCPSAV